MRPRPIELQVSEPPGALFDEPFVMRVRPADLPGLSWRARYRDDDDRVWRAASSTAEGLAATWQAKSASVAALHSLRPVRVDVRVEHEDGAAASRTLTRLWLAEGVRRRRWRDGLAATLHLPAGEAQRAAVLDGTGEGEAAALLAAPLLASRGVLTLAVTGGTIDAALERMAALPAVTGEPLVLGDLPLPPNVGAAEGDPAARAVAWDELLARAGARPRGA